MGQYDLFAKLGSSGNSRESFTKKTTSHQTHHSCRSLSDFSESSFFPWKSPLSAVPPATEKGVEQAHLPVRVAERDQVLGEDADAYRRTVRLRQLARESDGQPEAAKQITHRCTWASAAE
ncbi:MAG: hypothetical protein DME93_10655 [Verrucomicrobia bacterium]|nr:MAG: hypothetical protein DME93_10655 [Verrucomicrobiota bacterium]